MSKTSKAWPIERAVAKALTIPGTNIGLSLLTDIQDQISSDNFQRDVNQALADIVTNTSAILNKLRKDKINVSAERLSGSALQLAEALYLKSVADQYLYADFKGIEQLEKLIPLKLDSVFVNLRVKPESKTDPRRLDYEREFDLQRRLENPDDSQPDLEADLAELDARRLKKFSADAQPQTLDQTLDRPGGVVMLGGPGAGKTTMVKRLARSLALGPDVAAQRYPALPWSLPIVLPVAEFDSNAGGKPLFEYLQARMTQAGGPALARRFLEQWCSGVCLIMLDGLDEIADAGHRVACARAAGDLIKNLGGNRVLVTSRPIGYSACRLSVPADHVHVQPFESADVEIFARQWHVAYDRAVRPEAPDSAAAAKQAEALIQEIKSNPRVESLARNPLMLTIIALIKHQNVKLPDRRVKLYDIAVNTLIGSWNRARSLSQVPVGVDLPTDDAKKVWGQIAYWMHREISSGACHRDRLHEKLVSVLMDLGLRELEAEQTATSYITAAADRAGLLEERGTNIFAFMHQTFQEYLAARCLAMPHRKVVERVLALVPDPRWHEVIRLAAGYIGVVQEDDEMVSELVTAIAKNEADPLERHLHTGLRLALSCIEDNVRVRPPETDALLMDLCETLTATPRDNIRNNLTCGLKVFHTQTPGPSAIPVLIELTSHADWQVRQETIRLINAFPEPDSAVVDCLHAVFRDDSDPDVKAHAALGLWRAGQRTDDSLAASIAYGLRSSSAEMHAPPEPDLLEALLHLLEHKAWSVSCRAAEVLGGWGYKSEAIPALLRLLENKKWNVRYRAIGVLWGWDSQAEATSALLLLLEDKNWNVRHRAAGVLGGCDPQPEAIPALLRLLKDKN